MYDLVVVGAGPAGSRLARRFADRGENVVVLERGEVGVPLACSGHVSGDVWNFLPDGARDELIGNEIRGARFHVGDSSYEFYRDETVSYAIDRVGMDRILADEARDAGATLQQNTPVVGVDESDDGVTVRTDGGKTYDAKLVAGCDGPRSTVRDEVGLPEPDELLQGVLGFADEGDANDDDLVDVYVDVPDFFGWRIPRGDCVEYGSASSGSPREELEDVAGVDVSSFDRVCAGQIPIGSPTRTATDRCFLVGDSAAQTKPFTGGGIVYGMTSADIAARHVNPDSPGTLGVYDRAWRDELGREMYLGSIIRKAYALPRPVQRAVMTAFEGEINVHMDRPTTLLNRSTARRVVRNVLGV
ncbi:geranylgeranyl reductase family protein [Haladaptatus sp. F3-133]|uniref:Geranylgeranyl reductase family protein n=1 Tax=Halorutilus salinus TaxID=2487751 RepID=A0A9Q4C3U1_9EURY|nr:geranylgeranyl reductase family protein [Halorutilus salinus]MCX2818470.1 geranylgeranyl reductase family protein [Halorutilus salinus]